MTEPDTIKLLRECDAGIKMGTASIGEVLEKTTNEKLKNCWKHVKKGMKNGKKKFRINSNNVTIREKIQIRWHRECPG